VNFTETLVNESEATDKGAGFDGIENGLVAPPLIVKLVMLRGPDPKLIMVRPNVLDCPIVTLPKASGVGSTDILADESVPVIGIDSVPQVSLIVKLAVAGADAVTADVGVNETITVSTAPAARVNGANAMGVLAPL